jgi:hypothetical protein
MRAEGRGSYRPSDNQDTNPVSTSTGGLLPTERLLGDRDAEFLQDPLRQIDQPPAHHTVRRWDRTTLDHAGNGLALGNELGWVRAGDLQSSKPSGPRVF